MMKRNDEMNNESTDRFYDLLDSDHTVYAQYMDYIMENADPSEVIICNGDTLIEAAEKGYLLDQFREYYTELNERDWEADAALNDYESQFELEWV
jgi:hypothetical protein